ncbi:hypothetical protein C8Q70DRAFT_341371 [Cubamyces menziesii]|nr:hypothetical protein C8Q70DRAFT_341371 [Cubamyces menziesii]
MRKRPLCLIKTSFKQQLSLSLQQWSRATCGGDATFAFGEVVDCIGATAGPCPPRRPDVNMEYIHFLIANSKWLKLRHRYTTTTPYLKCGYDTATSNKIFLFRSNLEQWLCVVRVRPANRGFQRRPSPASVAAVVVPVRCAAHAFQSNTGHSRGRICSGTWRVQTTNQWSPRTSQGSRGGLGRVQSEVNRELSSGVQITELQPGLRTTQGAYSLFSSSRCSDGVPLQSLTHHFTGRFGRSAK